MSDMLFPVPRRPFARSAFALFGLSIAMVLLWPGLLTRLFDREQFLPHTFCYLRNPQLVWLHGVSDVLIGVSYVAISFMLTLLVVRARRDIPFSWVFLAFGTFIVACGATHFMEVLTLRVPVYWLAGAVKVVTAIASVATAVVLPPLVPKVLAMIAAAKKSQERLIALEAERVARREAEEASRAKDTFLATLSHELRTPMTSILGWSSMLNGGMLDESLAATAIQIIEQSAKTQAQLIDDLLDVSRIVAGKLALELTTTDLSNVIRSAVEGLHLQAENKRLLVEVVLPPSAPKIIADAARIHQAVSNLISNAIKFTNAGGRVSIELAANESFAEITVSDNGVGIEPAFLPYVFDRFSQGDSSPTRGHGGLGLGLAIVRHLIELHGGSVRASSGGVGQGASFVITLPLSASQAATDPLRVRAGRPDLSGLRLLLVEDEQSSREVLRVSLMQFGAEVHAAATVDQAMEIIDEVRPDIVVTDIAMPGEDGFALLQKIRIRDQQLTQRTPVVAVSALSRSDERSRIMMAGFDQFLQKPMEPLRLAQAVAVARRIESRPT